MTTDQRAGPSAGELALLDELARKLGTGRVLTQAADMAGYLVEPRGLYQGGALAVVRPASVEEVAFVVDACRGRRMPIVPQGGNTGLVGGGVPYGGIVLSLGLLNRIRELDPANSTITVEAGCVLKTVQDAADAADRLFPLSLASEGSCQIGGTISTNAGGTNVLRYGNMRDLVLGLEVVLADGRVWNGLGALRKDNTGYDLKNLFIGAEGTLGVVTAAVLKLFPKPRSRRVALVGCGSPAQALRLFQALRADAGEVLSAFEWMSSFALGLVLKHASGAVRALEGEHAGYALIELSSADPEADLQARLERVLGQALQAGGIDDAVIAASEAQNRALWHLRASVSEVQKREGGSIKHDVAVPITRVADFLDAATRACEAALPGLRVCAFGHFGDGNIHFNLSQPVDMDTSEFLARWAFFNEVVHDIAARMGGSISAEHGIGLMKRAELARYKDPVALDLMRSLKRTLDPLNLLNPGKVLPPDS